MSTISTCFYATKSDLQSLLSPIEAQRRLQFVTTGLFDTPNVRSKASLLEEPHLGVVTNGDPNQEPRFLIADRDVVINIREIPQRRGGVKYAIDQQSNPQTVAFAPGGCHELSYLLAGQVGTFSADISSRALYELIRHEIRRQFAKVKAVYVGQEAEALLDAGWRLTANFKSPSMYDLKRNG